MSNTQAPSENTQYSLYYYDSCPFCARVLRSLKGFNVDVELRDILADPKHRTTLQNSTGRMTVPCLRIETGTESQWMFESMDIMRFLQSQ
ncbi:MAG: glutaredoxin 2 [Oleispira sp.]|jgi:glutaredoxin 2